MQEMDTRVGHHKNIILYAQTCATAPENLK